MISPGDTIGILGGGQLARMLAIAGAQLGLKCHIYAPEPDSPAFDVASSHTVADYNDQQALARFAQSVAVITYEFENVPADTAAFLETLRPVRPGGHVLGITQDRLAEKDFLTKLGLATAPYVAVSDSGALARAVGQVGRPSILKTRRMGYDGKGQASLREGSDLGATFRSLGSVPCILEGFVAFEREISVVAARGLDGAFSAFDICENRHTNHILAATQVPAKIGSRRMKDAAAMAAKIAQTLDYVGVLAVEMFVVGSGYDEKLVINEIAPRVHNSGHWTIDGAVTSQFTQHIRAICGWPLGSVRRHGAISMQNLIGEESATFLDILGDPEACLHLYGKGKARPGRKMGHVTKVLPE